VVCFVVFLNDFPFTILITQECELVHFLFVCFQAVDFLVKTTSVSGAESADIGLRNVQNSTAPPSNPSPTCQHDHLLGKSRKRKYEEPLETVDSDVNEHWVTDTHEDIVEVSRFIPEFCPLKGENSSTPDCVQVKVRLKTHVEPL
jgi:hypothetical protein